VPEVDPETVDSLEYESGLVERDPMLNRPAFHCPYGDCGVYAGMSWHPVSWPRARDNAQVNLGDWMCAQCSSCRRYSIWRYSVLVYPRRSAGPPPNSDMPADVLAIYEEAREVSTISRKSAAGLLRLALQMLVDDLEPGNGTIDAKIGALVNRGLDPQVQQAMDVLRVVGNEAVHPGTIDLESDDDWVPALFGLLNLIVEQMVSRPKHVGGLFQKLPAAKLKGIAERDGLPGDVSG
jgi:hypothetical protein